jgi:hypothetical protein
MKLVEKVNQVKLNQVINCTNIPIQKPEQTLYNY